MLLSAAAPKRFFFILWGRWLITNAFGGCSGGAQQEKHSQVPIYSVKVLHDYFELDWQNIIYNYWGRFNKILGFEETVLLENYKMKICLRWPKNQKHCTEGYGICTNTKLWSCVSHLWNFIATRRWLHAKKYIETPNLPWLM
jgi:hypothetical protein